MKVVVVDTGRSRTAGHVESWRRDLGLQDTDEVALISWNHSRVPLPLADHLVFGPTLDWGRREPKRAAVTAPRRERSASAGGRVTRPESPGTPQPSGTSGTVKNLTARLSSSRPSRAVTWRWRRARRAAERRVPAIATARAGARRGWAGLLSQLSNTSPLGRFVRAAAGSRSDGVAADYAVAVARSAEAAELAEWADVVVPYDTRSRKAAWVLTRRTTGPAIVLDMPSARRVIAGLRR